MVTNRVIKNKTGVTASCRTIGRTLTNQDFSYERVKKKHLPLTPKHRKEHFKFSHKHIVKFMDFKKVVFTDEKRFYLHETVNIGS